LFPMAAVTNSFKFSGLKSYSFIFLQFWKSKVWNQFHWNQIKVSAGLWSLQKFYWGENPFSCLLQLLQLWFLAHGSFFHVQC
jgi:hypothetical protein